MPSLDDHIRDTLRAVEENLIRATQEAGTRIAAEAAEKAAAETRQEAEQRLNDAREAAAQEARELEERRATAAGEVERLQRALEQAREEHDQRLEAVRQDAESAKRDTEAAKRDTEASQRDAEIARREAEALQREVEAARSDVESARRDVQSAWQEVEVLRRARVMRAGRLPEAVRRIDGATTFGEVLDGLVECACREAGRAAVFLVKEQRLSDWRLAGFDTPTGAARLDIGFDESGPMAEAVQSARGVSHKSGVLPVFAGDTAGRHAGAWPISVGGSVVAVLYADGPSADNQEEPQWPEFLEVLARYAGRALEGLTIRQATRLTTSRPSANRPVPQTDGQQPAGSIQ